MQTGVQISLWFVAPPVCRHKSLDAGEIREFRDTLICLPQCTLKLEVQRGKVICSKSHSESVVKAPVDSTFLSFLFFLSHFFSSAKRPMVCNLSFSSQSTNAIRIEPIETHTVLLSFCSIKLNF